MSISPVTDIIAELRQGRMVVLMDDEDRENEGDLVIAAEAVTPEAINFMARHGRGLICMPITVEHARQLNLAPMVSENRARHGTNFTVSIEAAEGVTTGISAHDRARTIRAACAPEARPTDIVQPGHIFPLVAARGGVLARAGHTEACCDLARLAGFSPSAVLCEILNDDGSMARLPQLLEFSKLHGLKIGTIADLIRYRMEHESTVQRVGEYRLPTEFGEFRCVAYHDDIEDRVHLALVCGDIRKEWPTLVRVQVQESLLDLFSSAHRPGSVWTLRRALRRVADEGAGVVVIVQQPETADDLLRRLYEAQEQSHDPESGVRLRGRAEMRTYGIGSQILSDLGMGKLRVLGHPMRVPAMSGFGLEIAEYIEYGADVDRGQDRKVKK